MKKKNVVVSTLSEGVVEDVESKLEDMGVSIIEERYDLLHHRYEIYARLSLRQNYKLRRFIKNRNADIVELA
jgi:hypothetical protein